MELLQLKYFCDAAETQNFSRTAKKFSVPPSDISRTVQRLEKELEMTLFDRGANSLTLNDNGRAFYKRIKKALGEIENAMAELYDSEAASGEIKIYICTNRRIITSVIEQFKNRFPKVSFVIKHVWEVGDNDFDLLVSDDFVVPTDADRRLILTEDIMLAVSRDFNGAENINTIEDLKDIRFITMQERSSNYRIMKKLCNECGFEPNIAIQTDDPLYVRKYIELGMGVSFIPRLSWQGLMSDNVILKRVTDFKRKTYVYINKEKYLSKCSLAFLEELTRFCGNIKTP